MSRLTEEEVSAQLYRSCCITVISKVNSCLSSSDWSKIIKMIEETPDSQSQLMFETITQMISPLKTEIDQMGGDLITTIQRFSIEDAVVEKEEELDVDALDIRVGKIIGVVNHQCTSIIKVEISNIGIFERCFSRTVLPRNITLGLKIGVVCNLMLDNRNPHYHIILLNSSDGQFDFIRCPKASVGDKLRFEFEKFDKRKPYIKLDDYKKLIEKLHVNLHWIESGKFGLMHHSQLPERKSIVECQIQCDFIDAIIFYSK